MEQIVRQGNVLLQTKDLSVQPEMLELLEDKIDTTLDGIHLCKYFTEKFYICVFYHGYWLMVFVVVVVVCLPSFGNRVTLVS